MDEKQEKTLAHNGKQYKKVVSLHCEECCFFERNFDYGGDCERPMSGDFEGCTTGFVFREVKSCSDQISDQEKDALIQEYQAEVARLQKERDELIHDVSEQIKINHELAYEILELEKDKARLDFVLRCLSFAGATLEYDGNIYDLDSLIYTFTSTSVYSLDTIYGTGNSEYEAIDAAMEGEK